MLVGQEMRWFLLVLLLSVTKSTNNFSSYLEVLRIPCTSKEKLLMDNNSTQKSGHLRYSAPLPYKRKAYVQKSGTALLLFRISRPWIAFNSEQATPSPRRYVQSHTPILWCALIWITYPEDINCCIVLEFVEFSRFRNAKNKALMTPLLCL